MTSDQVTSDAVPERPNKEWAVQRLGKVARPATPSADVGGDSCRPADLTEDADSSNQPEKMVGGDSLRRQESAPTGIAPTGIADVGVAQVDLDRHRRCGFPE